MTLAHAETAARSAAAPRSPVIAAHGIGVRRGDRWLVRGVDLMIAAGEIVTLIGPNGGGKTTLAKALTGVIRPDEGRIESASGLIVGYVPQRLAIEPTLPLSVARLMTLTGRFADAEVDATLDLLGIRHLAGRAVHTLSGGEFQRALLARAIVRKPGLLVLDEPVQGVDFAGEIALYELIGRVRDSLGCGVLLISHDLHIVMASTDTVVCLNGHVCCSGAPEAVTASPEYRHLFGGRGASALAVYHHHHDHEHGPDGDCLPPAPGRAA